MEICGTGARSSVEAGGLFSNMADFPEYSLVAVIFYFQLENNENNENKKKFTCKTLYNTLHNYQHFPFSTVKGRLIDRGLIFQERQLLL